MGFIFHIETFIQVFFIFSEKLTKILQKKGPFLLFCLLLLLILSLVVLLLFCFFSSSFSSFSPTFFFLFFLFSFYSFFSIVLAFFEVLKHRSAKRQQQNQKFRPLPRAHRLRPLLFVTCSVSLLVFPPLFLLPLLCFFSSFLPFFCSPFSPSSYSLSSSFASLSTLFSASSPSPFFPVFLSLLITAFIPLRLLLQRQLAKMRRDTVWTQFICQNDSVVVTTLFNQFSGLMDGIGTDQNEEEKALFKEWRRKIGVKLARQNEKESAGKGGKGTAKKGGEKAKKMQHFQFSEVSLIRKVTVIKPDIVHFGPSRRYVGETVYVDFVHDFRVRMNSLGQIMPKTIRQIPYDFGTTERIYSNANRRKKGSGKKTRKTKRTTAQEQMIAAEEHSEYATIGGEEEEEKVATMAFEAAGQVRPRLPTTPIPRSLPVSQLASPCTPQQEEFMSNIAAVSQSARADFVDKRHKWQEKTMPTDNGRRECWCQFGTECNAMAHLDNAKMDKGKKVTSKSSDEYDEAELTEETD